MAKAVEKEPMTAVMQGDGTRKVTHPSGVVVVETAEDLARQRAELVANLVLAQTALTDFNEAVR